MRITGNSINYGRGDEVNIRRLSFCINYNIDVFPLMTENIFVSFDLSGR